MNYDAIVIGSGQGGGPLASALARSGRRTAIVEREHVGGTCINEGCTPTKTMVASGRVAYLARRGADYGVGTGEVDVDLARVRQRKRDIVESFRSGSERRLRATDRLDLLMGDARFTAPRAIEVTTAGDTIRLEAALIVVNTGARPSVPRIDGIDDVPVLTSTTIMELETVPEHLIVLGGGYIGLEFGQMFRRFGSNISVIQRGPRLLGREDEDIADAVAELLREDDIAIHLSAEASSVRRSHDRIEITVRGPNGESVVSGTHLLAAAGRTPNTDALDLAAAGVETDRRGFIPVDERLETNVPGIYAIGDVNGGPAFTHISYDDFRILRTNIIEGGSASTRNRLVPYTVYIDPQLGRVGLTEREAQEQGRRVKVAKMPMSYIARALETDEPRGVMKAVVDAETDQILGCAILGIEGGELMSMLQLAMMGGLTATDLRDAVFAHPTLAESFNNLFATLDK